jgi:protease IV
VIPPPAARPPRRGRGWMIAAIILLVLLGLSVLSNIGHFLGGFASSGGLRPHEVGPRLDELVIEDHDAVNKVALIEVTGLITGRSFDSGGFSLVEVVKAQLKRAEEDSKVKAVLLKVDSPGGEVLAADEIYRALALFQEKTDKPVIATMGSLAASGGYYVSAPCRWIVANDLTITGSIGVIMHGWNYRGLMDKVGVRPEVYKSGKFKDMLSGEREPESITPEERAMVQALIDETYAKFKSVVQKGRDLAHDLNRKSTESKDQGRKLAENWTDYADGRVMSGSEAYRLGFVDQLGDFDAAFKQARRIARVGKANLVQYQQRYDFSDLFKLFGHSEARVIKVDLGVEPPNLRAGLLYFLSPTFVH